MNRVGCRRARVEGSRGGDKLRKLYIKILALGVPPNSVNEVFTSIMLGVLGADCSYRDLRDPDDDFVRKLWLELGVVRQTCAGVTIARCERITTLATDVSPLNRIELAAPVELCEGGGSWRAWCACGAYETTDQTAAGETTAVVA